jgi:ribosomal protein S27E
MGDTLQVSPRQPSPAGLIETPPLDLIRCEHLVEHTGKAGVMKRCGTPLCEAQVGRGSVLRIRCRHCKKDTTVFGL